MQHVFEFVVKEKEKQVPIVQRLYVTESSRRSKVSQLILKELYVKEGIKMDSEKEFFIRQLR